MIGPLLAMALLRFSGVDLAAPLGGREAGQIIIATALGLYFTPVVTREVLGRWELLIAAALFATALAYVGSIPISRLTDTDRTTAFFASVPGGATEMAILGERFGGKPDRIALAQSMRILLVVVLVPFAFTFVGVHGSDVFTPVGKHVGAEGLAILFACTAAGGFLMSRLKLPNAWLLGALAVSIGITASGLEWSAVPKPLSNAGQLLLGCALGSRFEREFMRRAPKFALVVCVSTVAAIGLSAIFGAVIARASGLAVPTMILATAPGGIAEMCITAKVLQLGVPMVTAAHVTRVIMLVTTTAPTFRLVRQALHAARSGATRD
jgi:membrane AbrB-like protein